MPPTAAIQLAVRRRPAASVISDLQQEVALWRQRALAAEARVAELVRENEQLRAKVAALEETVKELRAELAQLKRDGKRSAGPFSKNKRKHPRKKPGRKKGQGRFRHLDEAPASPDTTHVDVPTPQTCDCGGSLEFLCYEDASNTDPPRGIRPHVTKFRVPVCRCRHCGATVRGKHPDVAPDQYGATAHRYGDRMMALGHVLHYGMGVPQQKVPEIVEMFTGVRPTQSALNQDAMRRSEAELGVDYKVLRDSMKEQAVGHTDATGWRVDGNLAQMIVYATGDATVYDIREHYRNDEIREVFPDDYQGTLVGDGAKAFDANKLSDVKQQKCIFHGLKLIREAHEKQKGKARAFGETLKELLQEGLALWHAYHDGKTKGYRSKVADLDTRLTEHLRERTLDDDHNQRLLRFFGEHHQREALTRFLHDPRVPPTNNLSELELRYLIVARKVSQCSKNERGAHARKVLASLIRTEKRALEKERQQSKKPYVDQRTSRAEERRGTEAKANARSGRRSGPDGPALKQVELQPQRQNASPSGAVALLDRVADLFREARQRARAVKELMARALSLRAPSP
jgi:transposase